MNWTGGRLQRHSGSKGNAAARQKQHFAKVQQNIGKSRRRSPIRLSLFDHVIEDHRQSRQRSSAVESHHSERSLSIQRARPQHISNQPSRHEDKRILEPKHYRDEHTRPIKRRRSPTPEEDLYNATPPPRPPRIKRDPSLELPQLDHNDEMDETLSEKRRRLLRKGDWVGISIQKPVGIKFSTSMVDENVGRRKKLTGGATGARYQSRQSHITSPFANKRRRLFSPTLQDPRRGTQKSDVRISIGGKVVHAGVSSSSVAGRRSSRQVDERRRSFTEFSDMMLLDGGEGTTRLSSRDHTRRRPTYDSPLQHVERAPTPFRNRNMAAMESSEKDTYSSVLNHSTTNQLPLPNRKHSESSSSKLRDPRKLLSSHGSSARNHRVSSVYEEEPTFVVSSTLSSMHQPTPRNSKKSKLLRRGSLEDHGSTVAELGEKPLAVPKSQQLQNEIWASWVVSESDEDQDRRQDGVDHDHDHDATRRVFISPGPSTIIANRASTKLSRTTTRSTPLESPAINEDEDEDENEDENDDEDGDEDENEEGKYEQVSASLGLPVDLLREIVETPGNVQPDITETAGTFSPFRKFRVTILNEESKVADPEKKEDTDELWRKFVFENGSDESDEVEAATCPRSGLHKSYQASEYADLSTAGHPATEMSPTFRARNAESDSQIPATQPSRSSSSSAFMDQVSVNTSSISMRTIRRQEARRSTDSTQMEAEARMLGYNSSMHPNTGSSTMTSTNAPASPLISMIAQAPSSLSSSSRPSGTGVSLSLSSQRKVLFAKPKPFTGRLSDQVHEKEKEPLHIVRPISFKDRLAEFELQKGKRRGPGRDVYDYEEDEREEGIEDIEDEDEDG